MITRKIEAVIQENKPASYLLTHEPTGDSVEVSEDISLDAAIGKLIDVIEGE